MKNLLSINLFIVLYVSMMVSMPEDEGGLYSGLYDVTPLIARYVIRGYIENIDDLVVYCVNKQTQWDELINETIEVLGNYGKYLSYREQERLLTNIQESVVCHFNTTLNMSALLVALNRINGDDNKKLKAYQWTYYKPYLTINPGGYVRNSKDVRVRLTITLGSERSSVGLEKQAQHCNIPPIQALRIQLPHHALVTFANDDIPYVLFGSLWAHLEELSMDIDRKNLRRVFPCIPTLKFLRCNFCKQKEITLDVHDLKNISQQLRAFCVWSTEKNTHISLTNRKHQQNVMNIKGLGFYNSIVVSGMEQYTAIMPNLVIVRIEHSDEHDLDFLKHTRQLESITLRGSKISHLNGLSELAPHLKGLDVSDNLIDCDVCDEIKKLTKIKTLVMSGNKLTEEQKERLVKFGQEANISVTV